MSLQNANFTARARVVDVLGREQIADAPTAVSELLKNAIDALATTAEIRFHSNLGCLQIEDNGLGMRSSDLTGKWLMLATDSKRGAPDAQWLASATDEQRAKFGLNPPLGEKGIGRLAVAALGRGVLIWTRWGRPLKTQSERTLLFIHWHLFQHPRLSLNDILIPYKKIYGEATTADALELMGSVRDWM